MITSAHIRSVSRVRGSQYAFTWFIRPTVLGSQKLVWWRWLPVTNSLVTHLELGAMGIASRSFRFARPIDAATVRRKLQTSGMNRFLDVVVPDPLAHALKSDIREALRDKPRRTSRSKRMKRSRWRG